MVIAAASAADTSEVHVEAEDLEVTEGSRNETKDRDQINREKWRKIDSNYRIDNLLYRNMQLNLAITDLKGPTIFIRYIIGGFPLLPI